MSLIWNESFPKRRVSGLECSTWRSGVDWPDLLCLWRWEDAQVEVAMRSRRTGETRLAITSRLRALKTWMLQAERSENRAEPDVATELSSGCLLDTLTPLHIHTLQTLHTHIHRWLPCTERIYNRSRELYMPWAVSLWQKRETSKSLSVLIF